LNTNKGATVTNPSQVVSVGSSKVTLKARIQYHFFSFFNNRLNDKTLSSKKTFFLCFCFVKVIVQKFYFKQNSFSLSQEQQNV